MNTDELFQQMYFQYGGARALGELSYLHSPSCNELSPQSFYIIMSKTSNLMQTQTGLYIQMSMLISVLIPLNHRFSWGDENDAGPVFLLPLIFFFDKRREDDFHL